MIIHMGIYMDLRDQTLINQFFLKKYYVFLL